MRKRFKKIYNKIKEFLNLDSECLASVKRMINKK